MVGRNSLFVLADLVSLYSGPLDCTINGYMAEAKKGYAVLEESRSRDHGPFHPMGTQQILFSR